VPAVTPRYKPNGIPMCSTGCPYYELRPILDGWRMGHCSHPDADPEVRPVCAPASISMIKDSEEAFPWLLEIG
jgi:hypothetical protein